MSQAHSVLLRIEVLVCVWMVKVTNGVNGQDKAHEPSSPLVTVKRNPQSPLIDPTD